MAAETVRERFARLQWEGKYEEANELEEEVFKLNAVEKGLPAAYSTRSSFYYSWAGNVLKCGGKIALVHELLPRLHRFYVLMRFARFASDKTLESVGFRHALTADQLDVRSSIYLRSWNSLGRLKPEWYREAWQCIDIALAKEEIKPHTQALLLISRAKLQERKFDRKCNFETAEALIPMILESGELMQLSRVCRHLADYYKKVGHIDKAQNLRRHAERWARESGTTDQLIKMGAKT